MTDTMKTIKEIMKARGYTQRDVALTIGVSETSVSRWMKGNRNPSIRIVERIAKAIGFDIVLISKGHGNLKDVDAIHREIERLQNGISKDGEQVRINRDQYKGLCYARGIINEAQTIIEADGGGEDGKV